MQYTASGKSAADLSATAKPFFLSLNRQRLKNLSGNIL